MEVILLERIEKLGQMGDVVRVKPGHARNYLLPQRKALRATPENKAYFETQRKQLEAENLEAKKEAESVAAQLDGLTVLLIRQAGDTGQLYGSVSVRDLAGSITEAGVTVSRDQVHLDTPIKTIGMHDVIVQLHPEVTVTVTANVARSEEEAATQAKTGRAVLSQAEQERIDEEEAQQAAVEARAAEAVAEHAEEWFEEEAAEQAVETAAADAEAATEEAEEAAAEQDSDAETEPETASEADEAAEPQEDADKPA